MSPSDRFGDILGEGKTRVADFAENDVARDRFCRRRAASVIFLLLSGLSTVIVVAQPKASQEDVKSAYLLNFGKFIHLSPENAPPPRAVFEICLVGNDPIKNSLEAATASERIGNKPVHLVQVKSSSQLNACDIAYIGSSRAEQIAPDLESFKNTNTLTVSDAPDFLNRGGMIQFVVVGNHVRFAVNLDAVHHTHLVLSSELIRVATSVINGGSKGAVP
jgi:YfiR/HmsC-like